MPLALIQKRTHSKAFLLSDTNIHPGTSLHNLNYLEQVHPVAALLLLHIHFFKHPKYFSLFLGNQDSVRCH